MPAFEYKELRPAETTIRLATLEPASFSSDLHISISHEEFHHHNSNLVDDTRKASKYDTPSYEALSYTWGETSESISIIVNPPKISLRRRLSPFFLQSKESDSSTKSQSGSKKGDSITIQISQNLACALKHLRSKTTPRVLWIDAICINQQDVNERNHEIHKMAEIYRKAERVVVWLGPSGDGCELAFEALQRLGETAFVNWNTGYVSEIHDRYSSIKVKAKSKQALPDAWTIENAERSALIRSYDGPTWEAVCQLLGRGWFKRVWIWQEIAFANRHAILVSGHSCMLWNDFKNAVICLHRNIEAKNISAPSHFRFKRDLMLASRLAAKWPFIGILALLNITRASLCSDPRDRIFALLRLAIDRQRLRFEPDYRRPTADVYTIFALAYMGRFNTLDVLAECDFNPYHGAPTWVPNWDSRPVYNKMISNHAGGGAMGIYEYIGKWRLKVNSVYCGKIVHCGQPVPFDASRDTMLSIVQTWEPDVFNEEYPGGGLALGAYISTLVCGALSPKVQIRSCPTKAQATEAFWQEVWSKSKANAPPADWNTGQGGHSLFHAQMDWHVPGRRMFQTERGHMGLAPNYAQLGDEVHVVLGCEMLLLLRPTGNKQYKVIGECYLHGFMELEALLGPLPDGWTVQYRDFFQAADTVNIGHAAGMCIGTHFVKPGSKKWNELEEMPDVGFLTGRDPSILQHPALESIEEEWHTVVQLGELTYWHSRKNTQVARRDPRLTSQALRDRGVDVGEAILI